MKHGKAINPIFALVPVLVLGLALFAPAARATVSEDEQTRLTFARPLRVSETVVLPPGTYYFRLASESDSAPMDVIEILDNNGKHLATVLTKPTDRLMPHYHFRDRADVNPEYNESTVQLAKGPDQDALLKWFYPGERVGHKFLYSEQREQTIAQEPTVTMMVVN